ncbi:unnamed protein product, partial [Mesorhabditis spiculigera]
MSRTETDADAEVRSAITALISALIAYLVALPSFFQQTSARRVHHRRVGRHYRGLRYKFTRILSKVNTCRKAGGRDVTERKDEGSENDAPSTWWTYVRRLLCCCLNKPSSSSSTPTASTTDWRTIDVQVIKDVYSGPVAVIISDRHGPNVPPMLDEASVEQLKTIAVEDATMTGDKVLTYKMLEDGNFVLFDSKSAKDDQGTKDSKRSEYHRRPFWKSRFFRVHGGAESFDFTEYLSKVIRREMRRGRRAALLLNRNVVVAGKAWDAFKRDYLDPQSALLTTLVKAHQKLVTALTRQFENLTPEQVAATAQQKTTRDKIKDAKEEGRLDEPAVGTLVSPNPPLAQIYDDVRQAAADNASPTRAHSVATSMTPTILRGDDGYNDRLAAQNVDFHNLRTARQRSPSPAPTTARPFDDDEDPAGLDMLAAQADLTTSGRRR